MTERKTTYGPGPETQGGGYHGGPKRWTGRGPAPARHIPWPEIFKHHISVVEGHLKMVDMVRKHTVEGTGNHRTIMGLVDRSKEMLSVAKNLAYTFVPPVNQREQVPLGSSSASMYPGYSPADHEYGKAAEEYGKIAAEARQKGVSISHPDIEYEIGQAKGVKKRKILDPLREAVGRTEQSGSGSGSTSEGPSKKQKTNGVSVSHSTPAEPPTTTAPSEPVPEDSNPYFIIDTNPTPVNIPGVPAPPQAKRSPTPTPVETKKPKKSKKSHDGALPAGTDFEDINGEVDAKMKEKEEKRRRKEEKKRKRESAGEKEAVAETAAAAAVEAEGEKPKKKKLKKTGGDDGDEHVAEAGISTKRDREEGGETGEGSEKKKKKKAKKSKSEEVA